MESFENSEQFVRLLTEHQTRLYGYVFSLVGDHSRAADGVQEVNLVLWRKVHEFDTTKPFLPWAFAIARFQVLAHLRNHQRDRLLLDAEVVDTLSDEVERQSNQLEPVRTALRTCLQRLTPNNRELIEHRYLRSMSIADVATSTNRTVTAIKVALLRIRRQLAECVEKRLAAEV